MKPVLLWPKPQSTILATLDRNPDDFTVVDTGSRYELRRLSELRSDTPILDPFPGHGDFRPDRFTAALVDFLGA